LVVALEWVSSRSSRRGFSEPHFFDYAKAAACQEVCVQFTLPARDLIGGATLSLELLVGKAGNPAEAERHLANKPGLRLGAICEPWQLVFDGSGSLFPIVQVSLSASEPLWSFHGDWDDATFDEFSPEFVALRLNTSHPAFEELRGDIGAPFCTPLFRQVLASWLLLFFDELQSKAELEIISSDSVTQWRAIIEGLYLENILPGSIANAAREFCLRGELDFSSKSSLLLSAQRWIDERFAASD